MRAHRIAHLKDTPLVKVGNWILRGQLIGYCGSTGNSSGPHAHYDIALVNLKERYGSWRQYTHGWTKAMVRALYTDPTPYCKNNLPMKAEFPFTGYQYLQASRDARGRLYFHSGKDLNGVNDFGKPIYSPVEGRVIHVEGFKPGNSKAMNGGWGCFVVIEEKPGFDVSKIV